MKKILYTLALIILTTTSSFAATTYYSSPAGSGSTCSTGSRCTIATGIGKLAGGDTLVLGDGTYDYQIHSVQPPSGSIGAPTVIVAEHALMAIIKPTTVVSGGFGLIDIVNKSYVTFDGIVEDGSTADHENNDGFRLDSDDHIIIQNSEIRKNQFVDTMVAGNCASSPNGIEVTSTSGAHGSTFDQFLNNNVHDNGAFCADGEYEGLGYYIQESDNIIDGNTLTGNAEAAVQFRNGGGDPAAGLRNILRNSTLDGNIRVGIFVAEFTSGTQIYNNLIVNTTLGYGMDFYSNPSTSSVLSNTLYGNASGCILMDTGGSSTQSGNTVQGNICYMDAGVAITQAIGGGAITGLTCSGNLNISVCGPTEGSNDPKFVSSGTGNFHLQAGSPAIGAGPNLTSSGITTDKDGNQRPSMGAWDEGAFVGVQVCASTSIGNGWTCVVSTSAFSTDTNTVTTTAIDSSAGNLIVVVEAVDQSFTTPIFTDSKSNAWHGLTSRLGQFGKVRISYCSPCTVGSGHTFAVSQTGTYPSLCVAVFSGAKSSSPFDLENGAGSGGGVTTLATGSITPSLSGTLVVAGLEDDNDGSGVSINSSLTITNTGTASANSYGCAIAYVTQGSASAVNPTWDLNGISQGPSAAIADFLPPAISSNIAVIMGYLRRLRQ